MARRERALMSIALHGNLRDFGISEVFQLIGQQRKTGVLRVRGSTREVELRFSEGRIVSAAPAGRPGEALGAMLVRCGVLTRERWQELEADRETVPHVGKWFTDKGGVATDELLAIEDLLSKETLFDLLRWVDGSFRFFSQSVETERDPEALLGAEQVLMDGLRMVDEWASFAAEAPATHQVFQRRGSLEEFRASPFVRSTPHPAEAEKLYLLIDGHSPLRRVIDLSRLGSFLATRLLVDLRRAGWIEPHSDRARAPATALPTGLGLRTVLANTVPLIALAALALFALRGEPAVQIDAATPIRRDPLREAHAHFATERMRNLGEIYRLSEGHWPSRPEVLSLWAARMDALTPTETAAYYFEAGEEGPLILAPEP
jgi:hypothetical protein